MLLIFDCGCRLTTFWSNESEEEKAMLGCCDKHEKPYQKIKDILPLNLVEVRFENGRSH